MIKFGVRLPETLLEEVQVRAIREKRTLQELTALALAAYLKRPINRKEAR